MLYMFSRIRSKIWGDESHACNIQMEWSTLQGKPVYYAVCESTLARRKLTHTNCEDVLNDMFYDYCMENASWMGIS